MELDQGCAFRIKFRRHLHPPIFISLQNTQFMPALRLLIPRALSIASSSRALPLQSPRQFRPLHTGRRYSYNMAQHGHSAACCSIPPIVSKGYEAKGKYETIGGMKTCEPLSSYHRYLPQLPWLTTPFKMSLALPMPPRPSSMSSTSSDTSHSPSRERISSPRRIRTISTRSSCPISSTTSLPTSLGSLPLRLHLPLSSKANI